MTMSGNFFLDSPVAPKLDLTGARSQFFRSPKTPSAASSLCRSVTSTAHPASRKRARYGYNDIDNHQRIGSFDDRITWGEGQSTQFNDPMSPAPLVNTDYRLAGGGLESHKVSMGASTAVLEQDDNGEMDYRPSRYSSYPSTPSEGNKRKRERPSSSGNDAEHNDESSAPSSSGWGKAVINLVGGVAGKVWDFCWTGAFRGFYAGGGRGYDVDPPAGNADMTPSLDQSAWEKLHQTDEPSAFTFTTPNEPFGSKRQQADNDWVLVKDEKELSTPSPSQIPRRIPRRSGSTPHTTPRRPALRPTPKRTSLIPVRPSSSLPQHYQTSQTFTTSSPIVDSLAKTPKESSPLAVEAQRYAAKIRRREKEEDASIRRLNQQLKAMIREGKEALGTKIEIDDAMDMDDFERIP